MKDDPVFVTLISSPLFLDAPQPVDLAGERHGGTLPHHVERFDKFRSVLPLATPGQRLEVRGGGR
jgi:hypothetical protein